jgi:hypothetical protein
MADLSLVEENAGMTNREALDACEEFGRDIMLLDNPQGKMLNILMEMKVRATDGTLSPDYYRAYTVAMEGFRQLFAPKEG